jgi:hypothetical protein
MKQTKNSLPNMFNFNRKRLRISSQFVLAGMIGTIVLSAAIFFAVEAYSRRPENKHLGSESASSPPSGTLPRPPTLQSERVEVELITILPSGFEPKEITRPAGLFALAVENRSGLEDSELFLETESGSRLHNAHMPNRKLDWKQGLDLSPGSYVLGEVSHPEWRCVITITPR